MPHESKVFARYMRSLPRKIYVEKMANSYRGGTPDYYLEGPYGVTLWVETKLAPNKPTKLQWHWIQRAWKNGVRAWVLTRKSDMSFRVQSDEKMLVDLSNWDHMRNFIVCFMTQQPKGGETHGPGTTDGSA